MIINKSKKSPNFDQIQIPVEFIVIHYTACSLDSTISIFTDKGRKVSSHLVLAEDGEIFELVPCCEDIPLKAWHAGESKYKLGAKEWANFNDFSLGIEIINLNGNIFQYKDAQYKSLVEIINHFKKKYQCLQDPERIIGHEHISGYRGKVDPGWNFDWNRIYSSCYPGQPAPERQPALPLEIRDSSQKIIENLPEGKRKEEDFWQNLNLTMEKTVKVMRETK